MATLRGPDGCPWDREQTIDTLKPFVLEETYEVLEAIDRHDHAALCEELGDFVFEAVFLAQLESEEGHFTIADSLQSIADKLVRRHPHVFARESRRSTARLRRSGTDAVGRDQGAGTSLERSTGEAEDASQRHRAGAPGAPPRVSHRRQGFIGRLRLAGVDGVMNKIQEEVDELREVVEAGGAVDQTRAEEEMGDLLYAIANLSRKLGIEPETALRKANDKFTRRFTAMEGAISGSQRSMAEMSLEELEAEWQRIKSEQQAG